MSRWDYQQDCIKAMEIVRRINKGDESAFKEIEPLVKRVDDREARNLAEQDALFQRRAKRVKGDRKRSGRFDIAPARDGGCDHSASGIILLRMGETWLVWRSGGSYWSGRSQQYAPAELEVRYPLSTHHHMPGKITDHFNNPTGARLSAALVLKHADKIDKVFGKGAAQAAATLKGTVTWPKQ